MVLHRNISLKK
jgi:hypothetical protein